jgi:prophage regulatory protein
MADDTFPRPVSLGSRAVAWIESEVQDWILERIEERDLLSETA